MRVLENGDGASIVIGSQGHGFYSFIWKLDVGIASPAGAAYWLAVIAIVLAKRRVARTRKPNVMAGDAPSTDDASDPADHGAHP